MRPGPSKISGNAKGDDASARRICFVWRKTQIETKERVSFSYYRTVFPPHVQPALAFKENGSG